MDVVYDARVQGAQMFVSDPVDNVTILWGPAGMRSPAGPLLGRALGDARKNDCAIAATNNARIKDSDHRPTGMAGLYVFRTEHQVGRKSLDHRLKINSFEGSLSVVTGPREPSLIIDCRLMGKSVGGAC